MNTSPAPVARLLRYIGSDIYPKGLADQGHVIARSYAELKDGDYADTWEKVAELYTHSNPVLPMKYRRMEHNAELQAKNDKMRAALEAASIYISSYIKGSTISRGEEVLKQIYAATI